MSYVSVWPLFLPSMLYHNWDRLYIIFLLRLRGTPSWVLDFLVAAFFSSSYVFKKNYEFVVYLASSCLNGSDAFFPSFLHPGLLQKFLTFFIV